MADAPQSFFLNIPDDFQKKLKVFHSIEGSSPNFSVSEICEKSGISRSTFYRYFGSQEDFCCWYILFCSSMALDHVGQALTWKEGLTRHFQMLQQEKNVLKICAEWGDGCTTSYLESYRKGVLSKCAATHGLDVSLATVKFQIDVYSHSEVWSTIRWLRTDARQSPEELAVLLESCIPEQLRKALEPRKRPTL